MTLSSALAPEQATFVRLQSLIERLANCAAYDWDDLWHTLVDVFVPDR
jgi:hypothetical protein